MMEQDIVSGALQTAHGISEFGLMVVICAFFILISAGMMIFMFRWMVNTINDVMKTNKEMLAKLDAQMQENNKIMQSIAEGLRPETDQRIRILSKSMFNLAKYELMEIVDTVRTENHIVDREGTEAKIIKLVTNLHEDKNTDFGYYTYRGRKLSTYTNNDWIEWMKQGVVNEVYNEKGFNKDRMDTNITAIFDRIKLDFHHRLHD
jgi:D-mannonate dehydratase